MSSALAELIDQVLALPSDDRLVVAQRVWDSLEQFNGEDVEQAWTAEADRRWEDIEQGRVECVPAAEALRKARSALKR